MQVSTIIILLGLLIFFSHAFNGLFDRTKIPNVLLLLLIGIIVGPITGLINKSFFGDFGSIFTTITLIVILFESGTGLKFKEIGGAITSASILTIVNFILSATITAVLVNVFGGLSWLNAVFTGAIIGGTSSAVVIPMVRQLKIGQKSATILFLESALSDVLCLVVGLALLEGMKIGAISISDVLSKMWKAFLFAALLGVIGGFIWSIILNLIRSIKNSMFTSLAFVFIIYGGVELLGFNGGIAALSYGVVLGNSELINQSKWFNKLFRFKTGTLSTSEKDFFGEIVFVLQTYFFVFVGICIQFGNFWTYFLGLIIVAVIIFIRPFTIRILVGKKSEVKDLAVMSIMTPKGLVPAVLASLPLQFGIIGGERIQDLGFAIVLFSILICSILVIIISKEPLFVKSFFKKDFEIIDTEEKNQNDDNTKGIIS